MFKHNFFLPQIKFQLQRVLWETNDKFVTKFFTKLCPPYYEYTCYDGKFWPNKKNKIATKYFIAYDLQGDKFYICCG